MTKRTAVLLALLAVVGLTGAACSEDAAVEIATEVAADLGADPSCVASVEAMVRASVSVSDELVDGEEEDLASMLDALAAFVDAAPEEVRADAQTLFDAYGDVLEASDAGDAAAQADAEALLGSPEVEAAGAAIGEWFTTHCGGGEATSTTID